MHADANDAARFVKLPRVSIRTLQRDGNEIIAVIQSHQCRGVPGGFLKLDDGPVEAVPRVFIAVPNILTNDDPVDVCQQLEETRDVWSVAGHRLRFRTSGRETHELAGAQKDRRHEPENMHGRRNGSMDPRSVLLPRIETLAPAELVSVEPAQPSP